MFDFILTKMIMIHFFIKKNIYINFKIILASFWGAPQENNAKFRFATHLQGVRQFITTVK